MVKRHFLRCIGVLPPLLAVAGVSPVFAQRKEDTTLGAEFIDMPVLPQAEQEPVADEKEHPRYVPGYRLTPAIGLSPYIPQQYSSLPGAITPPFSSRVPDGGWRFNFHGYLQQPVVVGIGQRDNAFEGQKVTTFHADPVVPGGSFGFFDHTNTVPNPWAQLNFHYGNGSVEATVIVGAWRTGQAQFSSGYYQAPSQVWVNDAFLTYTPNLGPVGLTLRTGAFADRYGSMAQYSQGAYGLAFMGQVNGVGTTGSLTLPFENEVTIGLESGFKGDFNKVPVGVVPENPNEFSIEGEGSTWVAHAHLSATYLGNYTLAAHYTHSWSQDDRIDGSLPFDQNITQDHPVDGFIRLRGIDARANLGRFGYAYLGYAEIRGRDSLSVSNTFQVLNSGGGKDFSERFWGLPSNGNGDIKLVAGQYTVSLGTLLRHPFEFYGDGPDIQVSLFGIVGRSDSPSELFDDRRLLKVGTEGTYSMLPWLATSLRIDHVRPDRDDPDRTFSVISPKVILRTDWQTREALTFQYAGYLLGDATRVEGDTRLLNTPSGNPDKHLVAMYVTMWW